MILGQEGYLRIFPYRTGKSVYAMSNQQLINEIHQIVSELPKEHLEEVLSYLKSTRKLSNKKLKLAQDFNQILKEDRGLLGRLAQ